MPAIRLDARRVDNLKPRKRPYDIRDRDLKGFGVRVLPSGRKTWFVYSQVRGLRTWKTVGDAAALGAGEARERARLMLAAIRSGDDPDGAAAPGIAFETVAEETFRRYGRNWKPNTLRVKRGYYRKHILPRFAGRPIADIDAREVRPWYASLHRTPATAHQALMLLSVIMGQAEAYGYRSEGSNPCRGIRCRSLKGRERFLSADEYRRLGTALARHEAERPLQVAIIRLLALTGCRSGEILTLRWPFYREGNLYLSDSKTGPRTVWLSTDARGVLDALPRRSKWTFPSPCTKGCLVKRGIDRTWWTIRSEAGLEDVRLHDLRHSYASVAMAGGETVLAVGRLLGHGSPATTLKYAHASDAMVRDALDLAAGALTED